VPGRVGSLAAKKPPALRQQPGGRPEGEGSDMTDRTEGADTAEASRATMLKELLRRRHWLAYKQFRREYDRVAARIDKELAGTYPSEATYHRWLSGRIVGLPRSESCAVLEAMFPGYTVDQLFEFHGKGAGLADSGQAHRHKISVGNEIDESQSGLALTPSIGPSSSTAEVMLMESANESTNLLAWAEVSNVGDLTIEQIHADIRRISHSYLKAPTLPLFERTRALRGRVAGLLAGGRQKPSQSRDLYSAAGWACTLLAWISIDLDAPEIAENHLRAAWAFADNAEQNNLKAWIRAGQHTAAFWQEDYMGAAQYAEDGLRYAGSGTSELFLRSALALDRARSGDIQRAIEILDRAQRTADKSPTGVDALTGPCTCSVGRAGGFWSDTRLALGDYRSALEHAESAIREFESTPPEQRNFGSERMIRCQQTKAHLVAGDLDGAIESLGPVLDTSPEHRVRPLLQRVSEISHMAARFNERHSVMATDLRDATAEFQEVRAVAVLPLGSPARSEEPE
jgi:tetratricopeptide (TPR) repeat protein